MKPTELAKRLDRSAATIRRYSTEFAEFLSPSATSGRRSYDDIDSRIIAFVSEERRRNVPEDEIYLSLKNLQGGNWMQLPPLPVSSDPTAAVEMIPQSAVIKEITALQEIKSRLEQELKDERNAHEETRQQLLDVTQRLGELRGRLDTVDQVQSQWSQYRTALIIALTIVSLVSVFLIIYVMLYIPT